MNLLKTRCLTGVLLLLLSNAAVTAATPVDVLRNLVYVERESGPLAMDVYMPRGTGPFPAVLVVHGGAWTMGSRAQLAAIAMSFAQQGYTAAAISYRLAPEHPFPAQLYDCQAAVRWLREHAGELKIEPERIGGYGYSAGGHLVALLGALDDDDVREEGVPPNAPSARLQAVVAGAAPCDFRLLPADSNQLAYWLGGTRAAKPDAYRTASPAAFVSADDPPMFFFHGTRDFLVPIHDPQRMVERLTSAGVVAEMYTVEGRGHIGALFDSEALRRSLAFADRYLKGQAEIAAADSAPLVGGTKGGTTDGQ
ncbi:MAG: alpha/beta hydrolase [Pirellulales bacterium]